MKALIDLAQTQGVPYQFVPKAKLDSLLNQDPDSRGSHHQGVAAMISPKPLLDIHDVVEIIQGLPQDQPALILALDEITDAHNFGAIIRVAAAAGVHAIIIPKVGSAGFSPAVWHASAGTIELIPIAVVPNLVQAMKTLKDHGLWWLGTALGEKSVSYEKTSLLTGAVGLVMGSEGKGIRRLVSETCDELVAIPMAYGVESLNVSVATGIVLFEATRQRRLALKAR